MKKIKKVVIFTILGIGLICSIILWPKPNEVEALSKYGSRGSEVTQIQTKLKRWGYYNGNIDGIYGSQTLEAVKYFQRKNGLKGRWNSRRTDFKGYGDNDIKFKFNW